MRREIKKIDTNQKENKIIVDLKVLYCKEYIARLF